MELRRVVVTGLGALTPIGNTLDEYWKGLLAGKSGAGPITHFDATNFKTQFACEVKDFNAQDYIDRKEARKMDPCAHYAMVSSMEAMEDAGFDLEKLNLDRCGVIWGGGIGGLTTFTEEVSNFARSESGIPDSIPFSFQR